MTITILGIPYIALALYYWTMSVTPGPNNVMLTLSGVNFGFGKTLPHIFGIAIGCAVQTFLLCLGLGFIFHEFPMVQHILKWAGAAYLIYLALKLIGAKIASSVSAPPKPLSLFDAAIFQFINPKAWVKATTTATIFMPEGTSILGRRTRNLLRLFGRQCCILVAMGGFRCRNPQASRRSSNAPHFQPDNGRPVDWDRCLRCSIVTPKITSIMTT